MTSGRDEGDSPCIDTHKQLGIGQGSSEGHDQLEVNQLNLQGQESLHLQNGGDLVCQEHQTVSHLPPKPRLKPKPRIRAAGKKPITGTGAELNHEIDAVQMTETQGQGHLSDDVADDQSKCDDKENQSVIETPDANMVTVANETKVSMAIGEKMKPRAETPIVQGVIGPKILAKANMNTRTIALNEDEEDPELKSELETIIENRMHRSDSKKNSRMARVNVSSRVEVMLNNELFKKYLKKNEDLMTKLTQNQGRITPGGGIKKAFSNLDLRNIDLEEELVDPLSLSQSNEFFTVRNKQPKNETSEKVLDAENINKNSAVSKSPKSKHRRHVSLGDTNDLQNIEHELTKHENHQEVKSINKQGQTRSKFLVPSFQEFKKSRQNKLLSGHKYAQQVMLSAKDGIQGQVKNRDTFTVRESANLDFVNCEENEISRSSDNGENNSQRTTGVSSLENEIENSNDPVRSRLEDDNSATTGGQRSEIEPLSDRLSLVQTNSTADSDHISSPVRNSQTVSEKCNNDQEVLRTNDVNSSRLKPPETERDSGLFPEIKKLGQSHNISPNMISTFSDDLSANNVSSLPPNAGNDATKQRIILRASRKRRMPQPAPRTSIGQRPHSVNITSTKAQPVLSKTYSLDIDNRLNINSSSQFDSSRERTQSTDSEVVEPQPLKRSSGTILHPSEKDPPCHGKTLASFSDNDKSPCTDGTFYFPDKPISLETPKDFTFSPRDSPTLFKDKISSGNFVFPEPVTDTQGKAEDSDSNSSQDKGGNSVVDSDESEASKRLSWINSSLDDIFSVCENIIDDNKPENKEKESDLDNENQGNKETASNESEEIPESESGDVFTESPITENSKNIVFRSSSDVSDSTPQALRKRRERKERPYKSDPFTGAVRPPVNRFLHVPGKLQHCSSGRDDGFPDDCSLEEVEELEEVTWEEMEAEKKRRLGRYRLSNISDASTDSGVIGQEGSQEAPPSPSSVSSCSYSGSVRSTGGDNLDLKENSAHGETDGENTSSPTKTHKKKIHERKETILEIEDTEMRYGQDLMILKEHFYKPMKSAGLLTAEQVDSVFLNLDELISNNSQFTSRISTAIQTAIAEGDSELNSLSVGNLFLNSTDLLMAFENYCINQGNAAILLESLEREKELLRIFLQVSQDENTNLRRMPLKSFLILPVQRIMRYPLLLERLYKGTSKENPDKAAILEARTKIEDILSRINAKTKRGGTIKSKRRGADMLLKQIASTEKSELNRVAIEILGWSKRDVCEIMTSRLQVAFVTEQNWATKRLKNLKFSTVHGILITLGQGEVIQEEEDVLLFPNKRPVIQAAIVLIKEKNGKYMTVREPFILNRCIVNHEPDIEDMFELIELNKDVVVFKGEDTKETKLWLKNVKQQTLDLGTWRRRRNALPNIMIKHIV